jgi:hypothetical protein
MKKTRATGWGIIGFIALLLLVFLGQAWAEDGKVKKEDLEWSWKLFPRLGVSLEYGGFLVQEGPYTSQLRRRLELDALQYGPVILYLEFDEENSFGTPADSWDPNRLRFRLHMGGLRYDLGNYYAGLYYQHWCYNAYLTEKFSSLYNRSEMSIYLLTLEFLSKSMRLGMKDRGIVFDPNRPFELLLSLHYAAQLGKVMDQSQGYALDWVLRGQVRLDLFRYRRMVPYVEGGGELWVGHTARVSPWVEWGARFHLRDKLDLTPFFKWSREQEIFPIPGLRRVAQAYLFGGMRLEYLLDHPDSTLQGEEGLQFLPEIHGKAGYSRYPKSQFFGWNGSIELDLEVLRWQSWTLFFYTSSWLDTKEGGFGPDKVSGHLQYGLTYKWQPFFIEGFLDDAMRLDVRSYSGVSERSHLAGLRVGTMGMKPGHYNEGISFTGPQAFQWLNKFNGVASVGHFFQNRDWQYLWNLTAQARWDIFRWYFLVPYAQGEVSWMAGGGRTRDATDYAGEAGLRLHGTLDLNPYFRFQHRENARVFRGSSDNQTIVGIRALF